MARVVQLCQAVAFRRFDDAALLRQFNVAVHPRLYNLSGRIRLWNKVHGSTLQAFHFCALIGGHHNDRNIRKVFILLHDSEHFHAAQTGHLQIQQHNSYLFPIFLYILDGLNTVCRIQQFIRTLEHITEYHPVDFFIINDQHILLNIEYFLSVYHGSGGCSRFFGIVSCNRAQPFQQLLFFIHKLIGAGKHVMEIGIFTRPEI